MVHFFTVSCIKREKEDTVMAQNHYLTTFLSHKMGLKSNRGDVLQSIVLELCCECVLRSHLHMASSGLEIRTCPYTVSVKQNETTGSGQKGPLIFSSEQDLKI